MMDERSWSGLLQISAAARLEELLEVLIRSEAIAAYIAGPWPGLTPPWPPRRASRRPTRWACSLLWAAAGKTNTVRRLRTTGGFTGRNPGGRIDKRRLTQVPRRLPAPA